MSKSKCLSSRIQKSVHKVVIWQLLFICSLTLGEQHSCCSLTAKFLRHLDSDFCEYAGSFILDVVEELALKPHVNPKTPLEHC